MEKGSLLNSASLTHKPLALSVYLHVLEAPSPLKRSISVMSPFPSFSLTRDLGPLLPCSKPRSRSRSRREHNTAPMIRADRKAAGIPSDAYDLHSPRHGFAKNCFKNGSRTLPDPDRIPPPLTLFFCSLYKSHDDAPASKSRMMIRIRIKNCFKNGSRTRKPQENKHFARFLAVSEGPNGTPRTIGSPVQNGPRWPHQDIQIGFMG